MVINLPQNIPIDYLFLPETESRQITLGILRLDVIHPEISGNKWFKLKENLSIAQANHQDIILTFGGAYSNHLSATAATTKALGLKAIGIVRGTEFQNNLNPTLQFCKDNGMELFFVSREAYKQKEQEEWLQLLSEQYNNPYIIPEGGNNAAGAKGTAQIVDFIPEDATHIITSVGSGTTLQGILNGVGGENYVVSDNTNYGGGFQSYKFVLGMAPMKGGKYLKENIQSPQKHWDIIDDFHFGGFGKYNDELIAFMNDFYTEHQIPLDVVYTAKMMYGVQQLLFENYFPEKSKIICIHTGGLQGNNSIKERLVFGG